MGVGPSNSGSKEFDISSLPAEIQDQFRAKLGCTKDMLETYKLYINNPLKYAQLDTRTANVSCGGVSMTVVHPIQWLYILIMFIIGVVIGVFIGMNMINRNNNTVTTR
jgi:hypothetical protein